MYEHCNIVNIIMNVDTVSVFIKFLQACITPVAMISGVGLLLLVITTRMGRTVDRSRHLACDLENLNLSDKKKRTKLNEIAILYKRGKILRNSIACIMCGMIASCLIIPLLFIMGLTTVDLRVFGYGLFLISVFSTLVSLVYFFKDTLLSLVAIRLEIDDKINNTNGQN
jgi:hypothetical protein